MPLSRIVILSCLLLCHFLPLTEHFPQGWVSSCNYEPLGDRTFVFLMLEVNNSISFSKVCLRLDVYFLIECSVYFDFYCNSLIEILITVCLDCYTILFFSSWFFFFFLRTTYIWNGAYLGENKLTWYRLKNTGLTQKKTCMHTHMHIHTGMS